MIQPNRRKGFTLTELVIVIIIVAILAGVGLAVGTTQIEKSREKTTTNRIRTLANDVETAIVDLGFLDAEIIESNETAVINYLSTWDVTYLTSPLDTNNAKFELSPTGKFLPEYVGVWVETKGYTDSWDNELRIFYLAPKTDGGVYRIVIASRGPNSVWSEDSENAYTSGGFDDDIVIIMEPRTKV